MTSCGVSLQYIDPETGALKIFSEEELFEIAIELGVNDVSDAGEVFEISCELGSAAGVREGLENKSIPVKGFQIVAEPSSTVTLTGENSESMIKLLEALEDHDDVQHVHTNADFPEM